MAGTEELHHDEQTLAKVYEALLKNGIFGQKAVDVVSDLQNAGILFREQKPKRRGRPPKEAAIQYRDTKDAIKKAEESITQGSTDAWSETGDAQKP